MSDYFLADIRASERERLREQELEMRRLQKEPKQSQEMKVTLLGDFLFRTNETAGCDPYNATNGKAALEAWKSRRDRR